MSEEKVVLLPQREIRINSNYAMSLISDYPRKSLSSSELDTDVSIPSIERRSLTTSDYFQKLTKSFLVTPNVLPPNCRYIEKLNRGYLVVIEDPPCKRTIMVDASLESRRTSLLAAGKITDEEYPVTFLDKRPYRFNVALPYLIFLLYIQGNTVSCGEVYGRVSRLTGLADYLLKIPLPNISSDQYICFGDGVNKKCNSLNHAVENAQNVFWNAVFNVDYTYNITAYKDVPIVNNYFEWSLMSQKDPMFIYDIPWVKWKNNLTEEIRKLKDHAHATSGEQISFKELEEVFVRPISTGKTEVLFPGSKVKQELMYDIAQGIYITHNDKDLFLHVGDQICDSKGRKLFINSFIGMGTSENIRYIELHREDKKVLIYKFTKKTSKYIFDQIEAARYANTATMKNGVEIKPNDIIKIKRLSGDSYGKVQFIRQGRQYGHQAKIGNDFHIVENLEGEIFDIKEPEICGKKLKLKEKYLFIRGSENIPLFHASLVKYDGIDINSSGNMIAMFRCTDRVIGDQALPLAINNIDKPKRYSILDKSEFKISTSPSFRCGKRVLMLRSGTNPTQPANTVFYTPYGIGVEKNYKSQNLKITEAEKHFIINDTFVSESYDSNINFSIGEKVIAVDWRNPLEMLMVKTIVGFKVDNDIGKIFFILTDKNNKVSQVEYFNTNTGIMNVGKVRKIVNEINGIKAGTKIISKGSSRVSGFPKKDVNIIIGFIIDGGTQEPLVLCSNCQTLWFSDLETFELVKYKTKKWDRLQHAPIDISKIKYQPGDIIQGVTDVITSGGWFVWSQMPGKQFRVTPVEYLISYADSYALDGKLTTHTLLDGIPNPRLTSGQLTEMGTVNGYPNFHGGFTRCDYSPFLIPNEPRSFVNV